MPHHGVRCTSCRPQTLRRAASRRHPAAITTSSIPMPLLRRRPMTSRDGDGRQIMVASPSRRHSRGRSNANGGRNNGSCGRSFVSSSSTVFIVSIIVTNYCCCYGFSPTNRQQRAVFPTTPHRHLVHTCLSSANTVFHPATKISGGDTRLVYRSVGTRTQHSSQLTASASVNSDDDASDPNSTRLSSKATTQRRQRPAWALPWMPTWLITLPPRSQFLIGLCLYVFHLRILTQHQITFPFQLIPNDEGWFQSIGLDSLAGMVAFGALLWLRKSSAEYELSSSTSKGVGEDSVTAAVPPIWTDPKGSEAPWRLRSKTKKKRKMAKSENDHNNIDKAKVPLVHPRTTSIIAFVLLTIGYFSTGRLSLLFENLLYTAAGSGLPLTVPMHRSLVVLLGHLAWVGVGSAILAGVLSPRPFFGGGWTTSTPKQKDDQQKPTIVDRKQSKKRMQKILRPYRWYTNKWDTYWLWWTIGGYFVSAWLFNIADFVNQIILPPYLFAQQGEGVVAQLINPENNDFFASLVGYIAPCLSAPWWEEVLYRGYLLPALGLFMGFWPSVFVSGVLFSVHHLNLMGALPLMVLGWLWAALYAKCGNILVTILIHGMWNSRVFIGSWLGL
jgi:membrane protease YdiL (CAAX protease family)